MTDRDSQSTLPTSKKIARELFDACNAFKEDSKQWQRIAVAIQAAEEEIERLTRERQGWVDTAAELARNMEYYRGLMDRIGRAIGREAYTADDGSVSQDVLRAKVPEIIERVLSERAQSPSETSGDWRPIETVPDPQITPVLGAVPRDASDFAVGEMHQTDAGWYWAGNDPSDSWGGQIYPAYWQPLPEPPSSAVNGSERQENER